ncbi:unnamed protein product [Meloidogyne enterolobii]|uniref:Uncharacterized protein n=1 Tax=Meloidogyne enterolobii TaxID=390850 RepID=A0ACB0Z942_MELEN
MQNGGDVSGIICGGGNVTASNGGANSLVNVTTSSIATTSNIWTYDMDFFGPSKISEVFSKDFGNLSIGQEQKTSPTRKQFVEKEIQTDESLFTGGGRFVFDFIFKIGIWYFMDMSPPSYFESQSSPYA